MSLGSIDHRLKFQFVFWFGVISLAALFSGYFLAVNSLLVAIGIIGTVGLMTLPYHSKLSYALAITTFNSALIVPLFPGRPYFWEFAALLGWSGLMVTVFMRQYARDSGRVIRENRWLLAGVVGYCVVLIITMFYRGVGLRILGSEQMGGRFYFQQLTCAIFPLLFIMMRPGEKTLVRLLFWQCVLTTTFLISDFVLTKAPDALLFLLQFFELSGDAVNFEMKAARFGIRRFQSFYVVSSGFFFLLLMKHNLTDFLTRKGSYLIPTLLLVIGVGLLSGHRYLSVVVVGVLTVSAYAERFFTLKNVAIGFCLTVLVIGFAYLTSDKLPLAAQRTISFLPGIDIDSQARIDALGTLEVRRMLRKAGMELMPFYMWMGRGFGQDSQDYSWQWDPTTVTGHIEMGRFYNGFLGLMVNTGLAGTVFMLIFLTAGTWKAWLILQHIRIYGSTDDFTRVCKLLTGMWIANTAAFLFLHGDSEYAMKTFSLQAGLLICCHEHLKARLAPAEPEPSDDEDPALVG
ncbi:MAG: hypothetical protein K9N62_09450 [Verrucomicrobia bacterium]|jgi:hypothetical protein|nr:hypothetical protein [Verrucomicrobiota bacterium]